VGPLTGNLGAGTDIPGNSGNQRRLGWTGTHGKDDEASTGNSLAF